MVIRAAASLLSPGGARARLSILIFHRVHAQPDPLFPGEQHASRFDELLSWLGRWFCVLPLDAAVQQLTEGRLPARAAAITFDDGYADNAVTALPILKKHGMPATFFVATSFLDGGRMWNDGIIEAVRACRGDELDLRDQDLGHYPLASVAQRRLAVDGLLSRIKYLEPQERLAMVDEVQRAAGAVLPQDLMMSSGQVRELARAGMQIGAHTRTHPILAKTGDAQAQQEIERSKSDLEGLVQQPITLFAYPNGKPGQDYLAKHAAMVKQVGFSAAVSTAPGVSLATSDVFQLPRFSPWDRGKMRYGLRLLANLRQVEPALA
jgi:peptidoglycan/xylan/chitin deacetylase (PgdA/CDA1 family)